jgi:negative regulator of sigma E activity
MTAPLNEQLSACLDGELSASEMDLLLKRMARDEALSRTASRYSLISAVVREDSGPLASVDFVSKVARAVAEERLPASKPWKTAARVGTRRWMRPAITETMAAGIAVFAVLIVNRPDQETADRFAGSSPPLTTSSPPPAVITAPPPAEPAPVSWPAERLANYVVAHSEYSSPLGRTMVLNGLLSESLAEERPAREETTEWPPPAELVIPQR